MHIIPQELSPPKNEADFEDMCAQVYGVVYGDPNPKINGRRGQAQGGIDVFVNSLSLGRIGIQCKKFVLQPLTWDDVESEIAKADKATAPITLLLFATTAPADAALTRKVQLLSDERHKQGLFKVEVDFWADITRNIFRFTSLQNHYAPHTPGAAYHRQETAISGIHDMLVETKNAVLAITALPGGREDSLNTVISAQLDRTNHLLKAGRFKDALEHLSAIGGDQATFDNHQKARWCLQNGLCLWLGHTNSKAEAASYFLNAYQLFPDDERMAAGEIRGLMLQDRLDEALDAGKSSSERFPKSPQIWLATANARLMKGEKISLDEVPTEMRREPDIMQMVALSYQKDERLSEACQLALEAAGMDGAGFFTKAAALRIAVQQAARNPIGAVYGFLPDIELGALRRAIELFSPTKEHLWGVQSDAIDDVAAHFGYGLLLQREFKCALDFAQEAKARGVDTPEILRVQISALEDLDQEKEALLVARANIGRLGAESLAMVGEMAARAGNLEALGAAMAAASNLSPADPELLVLLGALRWTTLVRSDDIALAIKEITAANIIDSGSLVQCCVAARVLKKASLVTEAERVLDRAKSLVNASSSNADRLMLAELLYTFQYWADAAPHFEQLVTPHKLSDLHNRLLACYIRMQNRKAARALLDAMPSTWIENDQTRQLAIELGQQARDWDFLQPLANAQIEKFPQFAVNWLFKLTVALHAEPPASFQAQLSKVPEILDGPIRTQAQLAHIELKYGEPQRGLRRLYRTARKNLDEPEALAAYFINIIGGPPNLPDMNEALPCVSPGSYVSLVDEAGAKAHLTIDPDLGEVFPKREGYTPFNSAQGQALMGLVVGDTVALPTLALDGVKNFSVLAIQSAYRRMMHIAGERASSLNGLPHMKSVEVGTSGNAEADFSNMHEELKRSSEISRQVFETYASGSLTLSGFSRLMGKSPIDVIPGWPSDAAQLFIDNGQPRDRLEALALLDNEEQVFVIDAMTIAEFVNLGTSDCLGNIKNLLVTTATKALIDAYVMDARDKRSVGTAADIDGKMVFIEFDEARRQKHLAFAELLVKTVTNHCKVLPAYGQLNCLKTYPSLAEVLQDEELEILLLAKQHKAHIFSIDGRFRALAKLVENLDGVWPQILMMHLVSKAAIPQSIYSRFVVHEFLNNRAFISLRSFDLVWMVMQGRGYVQKGIDTFKRSLASEQSEFESSASVAFEFLRMVGSLNTQLGALGELISHLVEACLRHKHCPKDFSSRVSEFIEDMANQFGTETNPYNAIQMLRQNLIKRQRTYLESKHREAHSLVTKAAKQRPIKIKVLYCSPLPWLVMDKEELRQQAKPSRN